MWRKKNRRGLFLISGLQIIPIPMRFSCVKIRKKKTHGYEKNIEIYFYHHKRRKGYTTLS